MHSTLHSEADSRFRALCREQNWKCTAQRRAVYSCLDGNRRHPTVEAVWHEARLVLPDLSLDSVYRILDDFTGAGVVRRLEGARVIRYDPDLAPHDHYVCTQCGSMFDFHHLESAEAAAQCRGFGSVEAVELVVRGVCRDCQRKNAPPAEVK